MLQSPNSKITEPVIMKLLDQLYNLITEVEEQSRIVLRRSYELVENPNSIEQEIEPMKTDDPFTLERKLIVLKEKLNETRLTLVKSIEGFENSLG